MPCFVANCAVVSSPRSASKATFALKSAEYRFRLPVIGSVLTKGRTKLKHLSEIRGPPHPFRVRDLHPQLWLKDATSRGGLTVGVQLSALSLSQADSPVTASSGR